jgi:CRISPR-associated protein Cmr4
MAAFKHMTYFIMATDPLHVGTGGYRIGRVDNSILRDPSTNLPKIPGSSISGVIRNYAIWNEKDTKKKREMLECYEKEKDDDRKGGCGECDICKVFGYSNKEKNLMGSVKFFDAQIVFFPVMTMLGPKWITTANTLKEQFDFSLSQRPSRENVLKDFDPEQGKLSLGWIYLNSSKTNGEITLPDELSAYKGKLIIVDESLFSTIVNMNLEVRTSVRIDPTTGSAEEGALFTYEAIPRTTLLSFEVVYESFRSGGNRPIPTLEVSENLVQSGMALLNVMGIGGMNTRGFGRLNKLYQKEVRQ